MGRGAVMVAAPVLQHLGWESLRDEWNDMCWVNPVFTCDDCLFESKKCVVPAIQQVYPSNGGGISIHACIECSDRHRKCSLVEKQLALRWYLDTRSKKWSAVRFDEPRPHDAVDVWALEFELARQGMGPNEQSYESENVEMARASVEETGLDSHHVHPADHSMEERFESGRAQSPTTPKLGFTPSHSAVKRSDFRPFPLPAPLSEPRLLQAGTTRTVAQPVPAVRALAHPGSSALPAGTLLGLSPQLYRYADRRLLVPMAAERARIENDFERFIASGKRLKNDALQHYDAKRRSELKRRANDRKLDVLLLVMGHLSQSQNQTEQTRLTGSKGNSWWRQVALSQSGMNDAALRRLADHEEKGCRISSGES